MNLLVQTIGALCCAVVMAVAGLLGMNYLETNIWCFYIIEPVLIFLSMGTAIIFSKKNAVNIVAIVLFVLTSAVTLKLTMLAFNYGEQVTEQQASSSNTWAVTQWNSVVPNTFQIDLPTSTSYMDKVGYAGIILLRKYGSDLYNIGYFELNIILYAILFPAIAIYFALMCYKRKSTLDNYSAITVCLFTLLMSLYLFETLPKSL